MGKKLQEYSFRELEQNYLFIRSAALASALSQFFTCEAAANGILVYGYNDHWQGLGFEVLATACLDTAAGSLKLGQGNDKVSLQLQFSDIAGEEASALLANLPIWEQFAAKTAKAAELHSPSEAVRETRKVANLDCCRSLERPDEVTVHLVKGELVETAQVRLEAIQKMCFLGTLLQAKPALGRQQGEQLSFYNVKNEQGIMCLAVL